jgi:hypothetical protein
MDDIITRFGLEGISDAAFDQLFLGDENGRT